MGKAERWPERRKHERTSPKKGVVGVFALGINCVGELVDISEGGLAVKFSGVDPLPCEDVSVEVLILDPHGCSDCFLSGVTAKIVSCDNINSDIRHIGVRSAKRCNVYFEKLTSAQESCLKTFFMTHMDEASLKEIKLTQNV